MTTATLPTSQVEFEEALHDKDRMKAVWEDGPDGWADFCKGYAKASLETATGGPTELAKQMSEAVQLGTQEFLRDQAAAGSRPSAGWTPGAGVDLSSREGRKARAVARSRMKNAAQVVDEQAWFNPRSMGAQGDD